MTLKPLLDLKKGFYLISTTNTGGEIKYFKLRRLICHTSKKNESSHLKIKIN